MNFHGNGSLRSIQCWIVAAIASIVTILPDRAAAEQRFELSAGFSFNKSTYSEQSFSWTRRLGASLGLNVNDLTQIEFSYNDVTDRNKIVNYEDTTFHDQIYSANIVQSLAGKNMALQPYFKVGIGQLNRSASGSYAGGGSPPAIVDSLTGILGGGLRIYLTRRVGLRTELTSYLVGGRIATWKDNFGFTVGLSIYL